MRRLPPALERVAMTVRGAEEIGLLNIEVHLSPWYYEQALICKGMPHGLGVLSQWGAYRDQRPLKTWRGRLGIYPMHFLDTGGSYVSGYDKDGRQRVAVPGGRSMPMERD